jgi:soluble lytic murein transglycosylase-like protein
MTAVVHADARTGRLVRSIVLEPKVISSKPLLAQPVSETTPPAAQISEDLRTMVDRIASEQGVETSLVHSVIRAESNYNPNAVSPKGAQGLMQLIPATARRFGVSDSFNAAENILGGVRYLHFLLDYYQGDYAKTIAAYNAGESNVDKYKGIPPFPETRNYVYQVAKNLKSARQTAVAAPTASPTSISPVTGETSQPIAASIGSDGLVYYRTP